MKPRAVELLTAGMALADGWTVVRRLAPQPGATGANFSEGYLVEKFDDDSSGQSVRRRAGFLKALDFSRAFELASGDDTINMLQYYLAAFTHERAVLEHCGKNKLSNVVVALAHGHVDIAGFSPSEGRVYYLIFERADGDVRVQMNTKTAQGDLWCMMALRDITLAFNQIHRRLIAHQDGKPSNVLTYPGPSFKLADFGRSAQVGHPSPHDDMPVAGDPSYTPPEQRYGYTHPEFVARRIGCDLYMLGNLASFLFSGINVTAGINARLDAQHRFGRWTGSYEDVLPYVRNAFTALLVDLRAQLNPLVRDDVMELVTQLCEPDLRLRGHPRQVGRYDQYSLERYVSRLDLMVGRLGVRLRAEARAA